MIFAIMIGASLFGFVLTILDAPQALTNYVAELETSRWVVFIAINCLLLFLGCILESVSIIFITLPILFPLIMSLGFDPIWFNVVMLLNLELALITPPVGMNLFVLQGISPDSKMTDIVKGVIPFGAAMFLLIFILCLFPELATWLPTVVK
jgi:C4-dicarboxylate transporter DctM subunit